jgi:hypothetical protein
LTREDPRIFYWRRSKELRKELARSPQQPLLDLAEIYQVRERRQATRKVVLVP